VVLSIFEDLQQKNLVPEKKRNLKHLLMSFHTLMRYPTNDEREALFNINRNDGASISWWYIRKIQALKSTKIVFPEPNPNNDDIWVMSVDGVHFWITEPNHPEWSQDRSYWSHKYNKAGLSYELGISLTGGLVWMNGPFKAGHNDATIFSQKGLKDKLHAIGKKAIGDGGYAGHQQYCSTPNSHDSRPIKKFKSRALKRHEKFNGRMKVFNSLSGRFRHGAARCKSCVEAVAVICQYDLELGNPLWDILIEDILDDTVEDDDTEDESD
jgi:hypothetical protein